MTLKKLQQNDAYKTNKQSEKSPHKHDYYLENNKFIKDPFKVISTLFSADLNK